MAAIPKTACPVTREQFRRTAQPVRVQIGEQTLLAEPKEFSTGSLGFYAGQKVTLTLADGSRVVCQVGLNLTVVGSKELPH
jgi:hypothetical protein